MSWSTNRYDSSQDAFTNHAHTGQNYGRKIFAKINGDTANKKYAFIKFDLARSHLQDAVINSAILSFTLYTDVPSQTLTLKAITQAWREDDITESNMPNVTATHAVTLAAFSGTAGDIKTADITNIINDWLSGGTPMYGIRIETAGTADIGIYTRESNQLNTPQVALEWKRAPEAADHLSPSGGQAVASAAPRFVWTSDTPTQVQIQINSTDDFTSPSYDSGWQDGTHGMSGSTWDSSLATTPPVLTNNTTYYWRIRYKDDDGASSDWSDSASLQYRSKGTLAITAPGSSVTITNPTITHTFSGRTQNSVEYELFEDGVSIYVKDRFATTATSFVLPSGYINNHTSTYTIKVRVWDEYDRSSSAGTQYVEQSKDFSFAVSSGTAPAITSIVTDGGHLRITWTRGSAPDFWALKADGVIVADALETGTEVVSEGEGVYHYDYYKASPRRDVDYIVDAIVLSIPGHVPSAKVTARFEPTGIWLVDPATGEEIVFIDNAAQVSTVYGESSTTVVLLNSQAPVLLKGATRGLEGNVSGTLMDALGATAEDGRDTLVSFMSLMRRDPWRRLIFGWRNIPVAFGNVKIDDTAEGEESYIVSFDFLQQDEFEVSNHGLL